LPSSGNSVGLIFLKLFECIFVSLTTGLPCPRSGDHKSKQAKRSQLDRLYQGVIDDVDNLIRADGLKALEPTRNENKIPVKQYITV
jgi:hypothetical protein